MRGEKKGKVRGSSILTQMLALLLAVLIIQMGIYLIVLTKGGVVTETERNAFYILSERTANRKLYLENEMVQRWSNTQDGENNVLRAIGSVLEEMDAAPGDLLTDPALSQEVVSRAAPSLLELLWHNGTTGAFLVLDCPGEEGKYPGFYVRDYDPATSSPGNKDLLLERGIPAVARENGIAMDSYWSAFFNFEDERAPRSQFYFQPLLTARAAGASQADSGYYGYWSGNFSLSGLDREVITYSLPLIWEDGTVLGVLGVDVTVDYLVDQLHYEELGSDKMGSYFLGISRDGGETFETVCSNGPNFQAYFGQTRELRAAGTDYDNIVELQDGGARTLYGAVQTFKLYNANTPFEDEVWTLIGIMDGEHLLTFSRHIQKLLLLSVLISLALGAVLVVLAARTMTKPITRLVGRLQQSDPDKPIRLQRIRIAEIDTLTEAIENLSNAAVESAARVSKIISMTQLPVGVFEYQTESGRVFCSQSLFQMLNWPGGGEGDAYLSGEEFRDRLSGLEPSLYEEDQRIYRVAGSGDGDRWLQLFYREGAQQVLGVFLDVTKDMETKRRIEYERDYDILTDLYNRRAFDQRLEQLCLPQRRESLGVAALLMFDLDNLKYVNDTYGHDYGDRYIQSFARELEYFYRYRTIVGRRSGDEFNVFLYGYGSQAEIREILTGFWRQAEECGLPLPNGEKMRVRASGGLAWYPDDAEDAESLMRMADFAMYDVKHSVKGAIREFERSAYEERAILLEGPDALNRLIDEKLVRFAFQPILSARDGSVYGYELLMRPQLEQLQNLEKLFKLAKAQSKLLQMEELTWFEAMAAFRTLDQAGRLEPGSLAFINSIGSQSLAPQDLEQLDELYSDLFPRVVLEITELEEASGEVNRSKKERARAMHFKIALDDFGTGFNSEAMLVDLAPDLVKVDMSLVRGIDADPDRQTLVQNLIRYAKDRGILVVAEGVETRRELETLIASGVDFLQGFYLARPSPEVWPVSQQLRDEIGNLHRRHFEP